MVFIYDYPVLGSNESNPVHFWQNIFLPAEGGEKNELFQFIWVRGNGVIDEKITAYANARMEWLKQEERRDFEQGLDERIKAVHVGYQKISGSAPCPCGSGKKYKKCYGK